MVLIWVSVQESEPSTLTFRLKEKGQSCNLLGRVLFQHVQSPAHTYTLHILTRI